MQFGVIVDSQHFLEDWCFSQADPRCFRNRSKHCPTILQKENQRLLCSSTLMLFKVKYIPIYLHFKKKANINLHCSASICKWKSLCSSRKTKLFPNLLSQWISFLGLLNHSLTNDFLGYHSHVCDSRWYPRSFSATPSSWWTVSILPV